MNILQSIFHFPYFKLTTSVALPRKETLLETTGLEEQKPARTV
ncbi:hypothetical protein T11_5605 [Trichinella zimbabwensis]|uniref:Uncharacterized protein n=1 Tax=Trichinella zimbabwensis TaxID=268475 RepID=A0A0V1DSI5_9BILA|nr:hypothetical protein T11_5605 [Trichinella zimbabwensis]